MVIDESFLALTHLFPEAILFVSADGTILAANQAARQSLQLDLPASAWPHLIEQVAEPPEKLLDYLRMCARSRSMIPSVFTWCGTPDRETPFFVEGAVVQPRTSDSEAILLLRWRPHQQAIRKFVELNQQIEKLSREMYIREKLAAERTRLYEAEQQARQTVEALARRLASLQAVTAALSEALTPAQVAQVIIERSLPVLGAAGGVVGRLNEAGTALELLYFEGYPVAAMTQWGREVSLTIPTPITETAQSGQAIFIETLAEMTTRYPSLEGQQFLVNQAWAVLPLTQEERLIGVIGLSFAEPRPFNPEEREFMLTLARQCAQALERSRLYEVEWQARLEAEAGQQRLALLAEMRERNRLAQELHDTVAQALGYLNLKVGLTHTLLTHEGLDQARASLQELKQVINETYTDVREEIFYLRAKGLSELSFMELLQRYIEKYRRFYNLEIQHIQEADPALFEFSAEVTAQLIRTIQEALINIRKHAHVNTAIIRLDHQAGQLHIIIEDQGHGFDLDGVQNKNGSFGLQFMRERIESVGGSLNVEANPGRGTRITLSVNQSDIQSF